MQDCVKFTRLNFSWFWYSRELSGKWMQADKTWYTVYVPVFTFAISQCLNILFCFGDLRPTLEFLLIWRCHWLQILTCTYLIVTHGLWAVTITHNFCYNMVISEDPWQTCCRLFGSEAVTPCINDCHGLVLNPAISLMRDKCSTNWATKVFWIFLFVSNLNKTFETLPIGLDVTMAPETEHSAELWGDHNAGVVGSAEVRVNECTSDSRATGLEVSPGRESLQVVCCHERKITTFAPLFDFHFFLFHINSLVHIELYCCIVHLLLLITS